MRLFIAVELDPALRQSLAAVAGPLGRRLWAAEKGRGPAWVAPQNLHLTLRFLGEVSPETTRQVIDRVSPPLSQGVFEIAVSGLGVFPPSGPPRVIWAGLTEGAQALTVMQAEVERRLDGLGLAAEDRPFRPHLTIARVKGPLGLGWRDALSGLQTTDFGRSRVTHAVLFESRLSPRGPTYVALARSPLAVIA